MKKLTDKSMENFDFASFLQRGFVLQHPGENKVYLALLSNDLNSKEFVFAQGFYGEKSERFSVQDLFEIEIDVLQRKLDTYLKAKTSIEKIKDYDDAFIEDVENCLTWIRDDQMLTKLVTVGAAQYSSNGIHPISQLSSLRKKLNGYIYGLWFENRGVLGITPEPLFYSTQQGYVTFAVAGTIATELDHFEELILNDSKERLEHNYVIDDIVTKLTPLAKDIRVGATEVYNFGPIAHLKTPIHFEFEGDEQKLVKSLSPTSALGGFPSYLCKQYLKRTNYYQLEKEDRFFGGAYGISYPQLGCALVGIRNIFWDQEELTIHSGTGIVQESLVDKEYKEYIRKRKSIEDIFIYE